MYAISYVDILVSSPFLQVNKQFGTENITIVLWWTEDEGVLHDLLVVPQAVKIHNGSTSIVLALQYNVLYNVSVTLSLCGEMSTSTLELNYGNMILI